MGGDNMLNDYVPDWKTKTIGAIQKGNPIKDARHKNTVVYMSPLDNKHAIYCDYEATFYIEDGEIYNGEFPKNGKGLVKECILKYKNELKEMWDKEVYKKLPPLQ